MRGGRFERYAATWRRAGCALCLVGLVLGPSWWLVVGYVAAEVRFGSALAGAGSGRDGRITEQVEQSEEEER